MEFTPYVNINGEDVPLNEVKGFVRTDDIFVKIPIKDTSKVPDYCWDLNHWAIEFKPYEFTIGEHMDNFNIDDYQSSEKHKKRNKRTRRNKNKRMKLENKKLL